MPLSVSLSSSQPPELFGADSKTKSDAENTKPYLPRALTPLPQHPPLSERKMAHIPSDKAVRRYYNIENDSDRQSIIQSFREWHRTQGAGNGKHGKQVFYIGSPDDLDKHSERLFRQTPITLIIDFTSMEPGAGEIARFNDLLETPAKLNGHPISHHVNLVILNNSNTAQLLGPDSWRRIKVGFPLGSPQDYAGHNTTDNQTLLLNAIKPLPSMADNTASMKTLSFYGDEKSWERVLFGEYQSDNNHQFHYLPGLLFTLQPGETLLFQDAPWQNTQFKSALSEVLREGGYEAADGQWYSVSPEIKLYRSDYSEALLTQDKAKHRFANYDSETSHVSLNRQTIEFLTTQGHINDYGHIQSINPLAELCKHSEQLCITESLSLQQWHRVLDLLSKIPENHRPVLVEAAPDSSSQPESGLKIIYRNDDNKPDPSTADFSYQFTEADNRDGLFEQIEIENTKAQRFIVKQSSLLQAIKAEKHVHIHASSDNPQAIAHWSTLNDSPAFLLINGKKVILPSASVTLFVNQVRPGSSNKPTASEAYTRVFEFWDQPGNHDKTAKEIIAGFPEIAQAFEQETTRLASDKEAHSRIQKEPDLFSTLFLLRGYLKEITGKSDKHPDWNISFERLVHACCCFDAVIDRPLNTSNNPAVAYTLPVRSHLMSLLHSSCIGDENLYGYISAQLKSAQCTNAIDWFEPIETTDQNELAYEFTKPAADKFSFSLWLKRHQATDRTLLENTFRASAPSLQNIHTLPHSFSAPSNEALTDLAKYLTGTAKSKQQTEALAGRLSINIKETENLPYYRGLIGKIMEPYFSLYSTSIRNVSLFDFFALLKYASTMFAANQLCDNADVNYTDVISTFEQKMNEAINLAGNAPERKQILAQNTRIAAHALLGQVTISYFQLYSALHTLCARLSSEPIILLGLPTSGRLHKNELSALFESYRYCPKNFRHIIDHYSYKEVYQDHQNSPEHLFTQQAFDNNCQSSHSIDGPVLAWAKDNNPPLLILHGVDRAPAEILEPLSGLQQHPPRLCFGGESIPLTEKHKVVMICDLDHINSPSLAALFPEAVQRVAIPREDAQMQAQFTLLPRLDGPFLARSQYACACILALFNQYQALNPDHPMGSSDLEDILSYMTFAVQRALDNTPSLTLTEAHIHALTLQATELYLGSTIPAERQQALATVKDTFRQQFPCDDDILAPVNVQFNDFLTLLKKNNPDIDLETDAVVKLVRQYWQSLITRSGGKIITVVEGPAGWGKDLIINRVLTLWLKLNSQLSNRYHHVNASPGQWQTILKTNEVAMSQGEMMVISELNIIPPDQLESLFRLIDCTPKTPGYQLFATVNPPSGFPGREELTQFSKSCARVVLLNPLDLEAITGVITRTRQRIGLNSGHCDNGKHHDRWLARHFYTLTRLLQQAELSILPGMAELITLVHSVSEVPNHQWPEVFARRFALELGLLNLSMADLINKARQLPEAVTARTPTTQSNPAELTGKTHSGAETALVQQTREQRLVELSGLPEFMVLPEKYPLLTRDHLITKPMFPHYGNCNALDAPSHPMSTIFKTDNIRKAIEQTTGQTVNGDVTLFNEYHFRTLFHSNRYDTHDYRLTLWRLTFSLPTVFTQPICPVSDGVTPINPSLQKGKKANTQSAREKETAVKSSYEAKVSHNWQPLPGLSSADKLLSLSCPPNIKLETARSKATGQLLIRLDPSIEQQTVSLKLVFWIEPCFTQQPNPVTEVSPDIELLDNDIQNRLKTKLFKTKLFKTKLFKTKLFKTKLFKNSPRNKIDSRHELKKIGETQNLAERMQKLATWLKSFDDQYDSTGNDLNTLLDLIKHKSGTCVHRSIIFELLARYWGIPARQAGNSIHRFVEYSLDNRNTWIKADLSGVGNFSMTTEPFQDYEPDIQKLQNLPEELAKDDREHSSSPTLLEGRKREYLATNNTIPPIEKFRQSLSDEKKQIISDWNNSYTPNSIEAIKYAPEDAYSFEATALKFAALILETEQLDAPQETITELQQLIEQTPQSTASVYLHNRLRHFLLSDHYHSLLMHNASHISLLTKTLDNLSLHNRESLIRSFVTALCHKDRLISPALAEIALGYLKECSDQYSPWIIRARESLTQKQPDITQLYQMLDQKLDQPLADFYQHTLTKPQAWPELPAAQKQPSNSSQTTLDHCKHLNSLLACSRTGDAWQAEPNGTAPDIDRLLRREKCYRKLTTKVARKPAIIHMDASLYDTLNGIFASKHQGVDVEHECTQYSEGYSAIDTSFSKRSCDSAASNHQQETSPLTFPWTLFDTTLNDFLNTLRRQQGFDQWRWILSQGSETDTKAKETKLQPGCYSTPPEAIHLKQFKRCHPVSEPWNLDSARLKSALKMQSAAVLQTRELCTIFQNFLNDH
ncbi:transglutaminase domain-containing protein [uncultured Endozoicomonas sp.]|uniref:transglutaminase domain-containing protein n=1 Tax=uncultured Endozoicomonas sp. TaxID=432652 RepID=UPI002610738C|nr:transglutaminase domain-containing protein [uncultured Endozoicomonas sp.]